MSLIGDEPYDLFDLAEKFGKEFGAVVRIVKAAELLGFVETPGQDVRITPLGNELTSSSTVDQKRIIREQLMKLKIFELLVRLIKVQEDQTLKSEELLRELQAALPHEKPRPLFRTLLSWGRYAEIISLDQRRHVIRLYEAKGVRAKALPALQPVAVPAAPSEPAPNVTEPTSSDPEPPPGGDLPKS
jgi:NitT/TauT family transport system ATP-binding protein